MLKPSRSDLSSRRETIIDPNDPTPDFPNNEVDLAVTTIKSNDGWALKQADAIDNAPSTTPSGQNQTYLGKKKIAKNAQLIKVDHPGPLKNKINEFLNNGTPPDPGGTITESIDVLLKKEMYPSPAVVYDNVHYSGNKGFDNVVELPDGSITLGNPNLGSQMTDDWVDFVCAKLELQGKWNLAEAILLAKDQEKLTKVVTSVDRTNGQLTGGINITKVD